MGSFKRNARNQGPDRRRDKGNGKQRRGRFVIESLEGRTLLAAGVFQSTSTNLTDVRNGPMANEGQALINLYQAYLTNSDPTKLAAQFPILQIQGNSVAVSVNGTGDFNTFVGSLKNLGFQVGSTSTYYGIVEGAAPIASLPAIAQLPQVLDASPIYKPVKGSIGAANNEGETALQANIARQQNGVDGTGITIGAISDSVSQLAGGLADSVKTGDLPNTVKVIQDGPAGSSDEGRAMLENIHDIAPGAALQFATAFGGQLGFANNILALANAGSQVLVDDVNYIDEPFFQDGLIAQAVNTVVSQNKSYFSDAYNNANQGYLSNWRGVSATVGSLGAGTYMNFDPSGGTTTQLPITVGRQASASNPTPLVFQFDQPYATQEPAGSTAAPKSEIDFYVLDSSGNVVASGTNNNVATRSPVQIAVVSTPGSYTVVMKLVSGPAPGHVQFVNPNENVNVTVSQQFGTGPTAGGTYYPGALGHHEAINNIGVGAVPWWAAPPYLNQLPLNSEPFSAFGPAVSVFNPDGSTKASAVLVQNPVVSGPDGGNTSFFPPGGVIDTSNPPFPGEPATATNLSQNLPSFFGTSSAAPNVAAIATLMLQKAPNLTVAQIRAGLIASAQPMNGSAAGTWDPQGGFGYVNAVKAINAIAGLTVTTTTPSNGTTVTPAPAQIDVTFNRPVNLSSITASDLTFTSLPAGVASIQVGAPIGLDSATQPTMVRFPISYSVKPNQSGNGTFAFTLQGPITATNGTTLQAYNASYTVNDVSPPHVIGTTINGRVVSIQFDKALAPTLNSQTVFVALTDAQGNILNNLDNDPRFKMTWNSATNTVNLDYSGLDQTELPSGYYKIIVRAGNERPDGTFEPGVTDLSGNKLDGTFYGIYPTGYSPALSGPATPFSDHNFVDFLGFQTVTAPVITSLSLTPQTNTGIPGSENTNVNAPVFVGQIADSFPGSISGVTIQGQFSGLHGGVLTLSPQNGRGSTGGFDVQVTTNANGTFNIPDPLNPKFLPEGFQRIRLVAIGQPDSPPLPGLSSQFDHAFRIDQTAPTIVSATIGAVTPTAATALPLAQNYNPVSSLSTVSLDVVDPASPNNGPLATPPSISFPALNPATASNISNYTLKNIDLPAGQQDKSSFITSATFVQTAADFVSAPNRLTSADPFTGRIDLNIAPGLPAGHYQLIAHPSGGGFSGLTDAAGNSLNESTVPGEDTSTFYVSFNIQPQPVYITSVSTNVANAQGNTLLPYSYYEINPRQGDIASNPPTTFYVDFSNPLAASTINSDTIQLVRTAVGANGSPTGDFGTFGEGGQGSTGTGFSRFNPAGTTVTLADGPNGTNTRVILQLPAGTTLPADHYRIYIPNNSPTLVVRDVFKNQLDGEFLGNPAATGGTDQLGNPVYEDLMPTGQYRSGMSGDGVGGGSFTAGFVVVPSGNIVYTRPDYVEDPLLSSTTPDGSIAKPYTVLAPQAIANAANGSTLNNGDPNGGLNSAVNFSSFDPTYDRANIKKFARSAFYAASQLAMRGPVVIVALPGTPQRDPNTGVVSQKTFVLQAPAGSSTTANDGSASVPFDTLLVFNPGTTLKLQNASLFVQNQGSALQTIGGTNPSDHVTFTSTADNTVGANPNGPAGNAVPHGGDWGGIVFRNFNDAITGRTDTFPVDSTLVGPNNTSAVSGADDSLSSITFADLRYGGGAVPATQGTRYDSITLYNSRPQIAQDTVTLSAFNATSGVQAAISGDLDSFREDDTRRGPLVRRVSVAQNSLNGIWIRPDLTGAARVTDAVVYPNNPLYLGGSQNYTFDAPLPYILTSPLDIGTEVLNDTSQQTATVTDRIYMQPGVIFKFQRGAGIDVQTPGASINVGQRTYIAGFDSLATTDPTTGLPTSAYGPLLADGTPNPAFAINAAGAQPVIFTSLYDNKATTALVLPVDSANTDPTSTFGAPGPNDPYQPTPGNVPALARWGSISVASGAIAAIDQSLIEYGGGAINLPGGTTVLNALTLNGAPANVTFIRNPNGIGFTTTTTPGDGARVMITNNTFDSNADAPIYADPDAFLATDPLTPLSSGHPFFHNNVLSHNTYNALAVGQNGILPNGSFNLSNNSIWDQTDITYLLRGTIVPDSGSRFFRGGGGSGNGVTTPPALGPITKPSITLTLQSALPGTRLADGSAIASPGASVIVKTLNPAAVPGDATTGQNSVGIRGSVYGGAGFLFGVDNGVDPTTDSLIDQGLNSQLRILGIGGNETTGQQRVPVIITSAHDSTVGPTIRGVAQNQVIPGDTATPAAGDGGVIDFGANTLTTYNAFDIREGNKIDNADIRYMTRIEMQGGGYIDSILLGTDTSFGANEDPNSQKAGVFPALANGVPDPRNGYIQRNAPKELTVSNSNLSNFSQVGILEQAGFNLIAAGARTGFAGEPNQLFLYNNTLSNMPVGVRTVGQVGASSTFTNPTELLLLNNTFYNTAIGTDIISPNYDTTNPTSHVHFIAMDNIYSNNSAAAIQDAGQVQGSVLEYNLFFQNGTNVKDLGAGVNSGLAGSNFQPVLGDPKFVNAAQGDFHLLEGSAAIDAARSELDLNLTSNGAFVGTLVPVDTQVLNATGGIRNSLNRMPDNNFFNFGGGVNSNVVSNVLTLPGYGSTIPSARGFVDEWQAVLASNSLGVAGPTSSAATFNYQPITGERDQNGLFRQKDPNSSNVGFGSRPFFDIGAFEFRIFNPPHVTGVTATVTDTSSPTGTSSINLYGVGTFSGTNKPIQTIQVTFDNPIDPNTINGQSVVLEASNGTGSFANPTVFNLSGKLSLDSTDRVLTINVGAAGLTLSNDEYRLILFGNGSSVIKDSTGIALDGQNVLNDNPNNPQLPLPSGSGAPGTNFFDTFVINTAPPSVGSGSFILDPSTDSNIVGDSVTNVNKPTFSGNVSVPLANIESVSGLTVIVDISTKGNGVFDLLNAGSGVTDALGHFAVTLNNPLPDSVYNVGADGKLRTTDDSGYTWARVRVIDQSGNASNLPSDPYTSYAANNALLGAVIDTAPPHVTGFSPSPNTLLQPTNGSITFTFTTDKNIDPKSLNASSILVTRAGPDGVLGTADDVSVPINASSITTKYLGGTRLGPEQISFTVSGNLPNDYYGVTLKGTGTSPITDIAGNALAGNGTTVATDYNPQYVVISPTPFLIFVDSTVSAAAAATATGTRSNPYRTISAAMKVAAAGDVVAVLPGLYTENVVLKPFVKLESADPTSTDAKLVAGNALQTVIRAPEPSATSTATLNVTVLAANLPYVPNADTVVQGFSIASPLLGTLSGNPALGPIDTSTAAVEISNSNVLLLDNYITDANIGVYVVATSGSGVLMPRIINDVVAGNNVGIQIDDQGSNSIPTPAQITNSDLVYNTIGLFANNSSTSPLLANVSNDIFWQNHDQTAARNGFGIQANSANSLLVRNSLFQGNGASDTSPLFAGVNVGNGFNAAALRATPDARGNFIGNPAFVFPIDPRPSSDGPATFYLDANFDLQATSAAIDAANTSLSPALDFLGRSRVRIAGRGFTGTGPADVGAFEYKGNGGSTIGGAFRIASTSLSPTGAALSNGTAVFSAQTAPKSITVTFSSNVNKASVTPGALILYGDGVNPVGGVKATKVTWVNNNTAVFKLSGGYSSQGTVVVKVNPGTIKSTTNAAVLGFSDTFKIKPLVSSSIALPKATPAVAVAPASVVSIPGAVKKAVASPVVSLPLTPAPAAAPTAGRSSTPKGPLAVRKPSVPKKK